MITHYISSNGRTTPIKEMPDPHLNNALKKLKTFGGDYEMITALQAEQDARIEAAKNA